MKITLALCTNRQVRPKTVGSLLEMVAYSKVDWHILVAERGYTIAENRNYSVIQAKKNNSEYLLFIDDDMTFPKETLDRLLVHSKEVVGVNSYSRCLPAFPTVGLMDEKGEYKQPDKYPAFELKVPEELFKCYFVGSGVLLIDMKIFERIEKPYFEFTTYKSGEFRGMVKDGEDGTFCRKVRESGVDIWCDGSLPIGHLGEYEYKKEEINDVITI
jgi:hypothetical protein